MRVAVVGSSGFVGSAVTKLLRETGHNVVTVRAPRDAVLSGGERNDAVATIAELLAGVDAVINSSGNPDASETDERKLMAANALSPAIVAEAALAAGVRRLVHVSSAVVQGRRGQLDESSDTEEFSAYARSKAEGERQVRARYPSAVIYRPPSVHSPARRVTVMTARIAKSPLATVAFPGDQHTPQALIENVASAIVFLATSEQQPPSAVIHPWEGLTSRDLLELLGGKAPLTVPAGLARIVCRGLALAGSCVPAIASNARRVEMLWFGQGQADSWLTSVGWRPPFGREAWKKLGETVRKERL